MKDNYTEDYIRLLTPGNDADIKALWVELSSYIFVQLQKQRVDFTKKEDVEDIASDTVTVVLSNFNKGKIECYEPPIAYAKGVAKKKCADFKMEKKKRRNFGAWHQGSSQQDEQWDVIQDEPEIELSLLQRDARCKEGRMRKNDRNCRCGELMIDKYMKELPDEDIMTKYSIPTFGYLEQVIVRCKKKLKEESREKP